MAVNLTDAYLQWVKRAPDESFKSLEELYGFTKSRKDNSSQRYAQLRDLRVEATVSGSLVVNGSERPAELTHWSLGQLASNIGAPSSYLRSLSPELARECLEYGLAKSDRSCLTLSRAERDSTNGSHRTLAAFTGPKYGRIWDADVVEQLLEATAKSSWKPPSDLSEGHKSRGTGLYASDRDMFVFMVNEEDTVDVGGAKLGRGFFCWNSETGSSTLGLTTILYNYVCANHIVWGAERVQEINIYHRNRAQERFQWSVIPTLESFVANRSMDDEIKAMVQSARKARVGEKLEEVTLRLAPERFSKSELTAAWESSHEQGEDPRTVWGLVQGLTGVAQEIPHLDRRVNLDRRAGRLLNIA